MHAGGVEQAERGAGRLLPFGRRDAIEKLHAGHERDVVSRLAATTELEDLRHPFGAPLVAAQREQGRGIEHERHPAIATPISVADRRGAVALPFLPDLRNEATGSSGIGITRTVLPSTIHSSCVSGLIPNCLRTSDGIETWPRVATFVRIIPRYHVS